MTVEQLKTITIILSAIVVLSACNDKRNPGIREANHTESDIAMVDESREDSPDPLEKGYDLPIPQSEKDQAMDETKELLSLIKNQFLHFLNENTREYELPEDVMESVLDMLSGKGYTVMSDGIYSNIRNAENLSEFLLASENGEEGSATLYKIMSRGAVARYQYTFDGSNMYTLSSGMNLNPEGTLSETYCTYTRLKTWRYTDTGWFCYELCVPEYPEVTEIIDGSLLIRVRPISDDLRRAGEKYVLGIGYQGNNILRSDWDTDNLDGLDYTGMYEFLYAMDTGEKFALTEGKEGISADEFESLIMKYIPVTCDTIRRNSVFDNQKEEYAWVKYGSSNYEPSWFENSIPEVTEIRENGDGTITLTVNAVCEMVLNNEAVITHELTVKDNPDGSFQYLGNKILNDGINKIPKYNRRLDIS